MQATVDTAECRHGVTGLRERTYSNGTKHYQMQCRSCGAPVGSTVPKRHVQGSVEPWDESLREDCNLARLQAIQEEWEEKRNTYQEYLSSEDWGRRRQAVLERDGGRCQACLKVEATQVHHKTYKHIYNEPLFDLVSICRRCHEMLHPEHQESS
jgi:5-methylcytosine-specific restriction endonuclease McrA